MLAYSSVALYSSIKYLTLISTDYHTVILLPLRDSQEFQYIFSKYFPSKILTQNIMELSLLEPTLNSMIVSVNKSQIFDRTI